MEQIKYPQFSLGQISGYIGQNIKYEHLTYEQFVAGELVTIGNAVNKQEVKGRTSLLQRIATWRLRTNVSWPQIRQAFSHILRKIEDHEIDWTANWDEYERRIYDKVLITGNPNNSNTGSTNRPRRTNQEVIWFCKAFQKLEGCPKEAPHQGRVGNIVRQMHHICAACWLRDKVKKNHSESSSECPQKEA